LLPDIVDAVLGGVMLILHDIRYRGVLPVLILYFSLQLQILLVEIL
jgi:hypothetical protein